MNTLLIVDDKYVWVGTLGSWFRSRENKVELGTTRFFAGRLFYAYAIYESILGISADTVHWLPVVPSKDMEEIRDFRNSLLGK